MNSTPPHCTCLWRWLWPGFLAVLLVGCATTPKIDWAARVGNYTYDQTVLELGPPDRWAKLQDGTTVAEWLTDRGVTYVHANFAYGYPYPYWGWGAPLYPYGAFYPAFTETSPDYYLRLTFDPEGKLVAWKKVTR